MAIRHGLPRPPEDLCALAILCGELDTGLGKAGCSQAALAMETQPGQLTNHSSHLVRAQEFTSVSVAETWKQTGRKQSPSATCARPGPPW